MTSVASSVSTWSIDSAHSIAEFAVKHLVISTVKGRFRTVQGTITIDELNPAASAVAAALDVNSIDTSEPQRDAHLKSDDFFNAELFPHLTFRSTGVRAVREDRWQVTGDLTIRDVTRPVTLDTELDGRTMGMYGKEVAAFTATAEISRKDFGLKWNALLESGGAVVGDRVKITLHIEAVREAA